MAAASERKPSPKSSRASMAYHQPPLPASPIWIINTSDIRALQRFGARQLDGGGGGFVGHGQRQDVIPECLFAFLPSAGGEDGNRENVIHVRYHHRALVLAAEGQRRAHAAGLL